MSHKTASSIPHPPLASDSPTCQIQGPLVYNTRRFRAPLGCGHVVRNGCHVAQKRQHASCSCKKLANRVTQGLHRLTMRSNLSFLKTRPWILKRVTYRWESRHTGLSQVLRVNTHGDVRVTVLPLIGWDENGTGPLRSPSQTPRTPVGSRERHESKPNRETRHKSPAQLSQAVQAPTNKRGLRDFQSQGEP